MSKELSEYLQRLGKEIVVYRKMKKYSQRKVSELADLDRAYISNIENGRQNITIGAVFKLAAALEIPADLLLRS